MNVLIISPTFPPMSSGGADFVFRLSEQLAERGNTVSVVTSAITNIATGRNFKVLPVMRDWSWGELARLIKIVRKTKPDVVDIHFSGGIYKHHPMVTYFPALLKRWLGGARLVMHVEYPEPTGSPDRWSRSRLIRKGIMMSCGRRATDHGFGTLLRDSDQVIVLCDSHIGALSDRYAGVAEKSVMIPPPPCVVLSENSAGQARKRGRAELGLAPTDVLAAYYGYIYPNKGIETLLDGFELASRKFPNLRLVLIGGANELVLKNLKRPDYIQELKDRATKLGVGDKVIWTQYFPSESEQPSILLRSADLCVLPFDSGISMHRSTFGVAAVHDLPVISTRGPTLESPFRDGENILLCPPQDATALAEAMMQLIASPELRERLRAGVREMAARHFSWPTCAERTLRVFAGDKPF